MKFFRKSFLQILLVVLIGSPFVFAVADVSTENPKKENLAKEKSKSEEKKSKQKKGIGNSSKVKNSEIALFKILKENSEREEVLFWQQEFLKERRFKFLKNAAEVHPEYRIFVRAAVRERGLPAELEYLPVIESGYNTRAKSRVGATGMWQFMSNSVRPYLKLNEYVDERLDPWKSTTAGLSKLEYNYKVFGDWLLAIAAYNCGNGKMKAAIKKADGETDFWKLAKGGFLPKQTADYIPELIAVAAICLEPEKFGVEISYYKNEFEQLQGEEENYDFVKVQKPYMLSSIAKEIELEESVLKTLNPSYTKGFTPPFAESVLRLPKGMEQTFFAALKNIKELEFPFKYKVVKGDSLWSISRRYGVSINLICETNGIKENAVLKINQILYIPGIK